MDITLATLNNSRICHIYNVYSSINRGINKKEGVILRYFSIDCLADPWLAEKLYI